MKKYAIYVSLLTICCLFYACFSSFAGDTGIISINMGGNARSAPLYPPTNDNGILPNLELRIQLEGPTEIQNHTLSKGATNARFSVNPGLWYINVEAWYEGELYATGSNSVNVRAGRENPVTIRMGPEITVLHPLSVWTAVTDPTVESAFPDVSNSAFTDINAIAYGNGLLVAGGSRGTMIYSDDNGDTWQSVSDSGFGTDTISKITFGNGTFVAVGQAGSVSYSSDGITWIGISPGAFGGLYIQDIAFGNGRFVAGAFTNPNNRIAYSDNGATWTRVTDIDTVFGTTGMLRSIGYGNGRFIAAGSGSRIAYSDDDGLTWTQSTTGHTSGQISGIAYNNGRFVAGAVDGGSVRLFYSDDDGDNWNEAVGSIGNVYSIIHGNGYFVAAGQSGRIGYSSDGIKQKPFYGSKQIMKNNWKKNGLLTLFINTDFQWI
ncbi:MAG: glycoside hydrolase [Treponema sp.]|nr:glycoside hydrolase [Treponema sp.]